MSDDDDEELEAFCKENKGKFCYMYKLMQAVKSDNVEEVKNILKEHDVLATDTPYFNDPESDFYDMNYNSEDNGGHCISVGNFIKFKGSRTCQEAIAPLLLKSVFEKGGSGEVVFKVAITPDLIKKVCECDESPQDIRCQMLGDYYQTEKTLNDRPVFTNGEVHCWYDTSQEAWCWTTKQGFSGRQAQTYVKSSVQSPAELAGAPLDFKAGWDPDKSLSDVCLEVAVLVK